MESLLGIVIRSVVVYLFIIFAIRLSGKKELSQLSIVDLVFVLLISNAVQSAMVGSNTTLVGGIIAALSLFVVNRLFELALFRFRRVDKFIEGSPTMLVYHGKIVMEHLRKAKITTDELAAAIREHGVSKIDAVDLAVLEIDGTISVLSENFQRKTVRRRKDHRVLEKSFS